MSIVLRTLLVLDHDNHVTLILEELHHGGFKTIPKRVKTLHSLSVALHHGKWDLIISDYKPSQFSILKLFSLLKENDSAEIPVFLISDKSNKTRIVSAIRAGAHDIFPLNDLSSLTLSVKKKLSKSGKRPVPPSSGALDMNSDKKYQLLFDGIPLGLYQSSPSGKITNVNAAMVQIMGYPDKTSLLATHATKLYVNPNDRKKWQNQLEKERVLHASEVQFYRHDRSKIWVRESTRAILNDKKIVIYYEGAIEDITEHKQTEHELRRRIREQIVLNTITANASEVEDEESLFKHTTAIIRDLLFPDSFGIMLVDEAAGVLHLTSSFQTQPNESKNLVIPLGKGITGKVALTGIPRRIADTRKDPDYIKVRTEMRAEITVPIRVNQKIIGVMDAESKQPDTFTESDERILSTLAHQLAGTLERLRVVKALKNEHDFLSGVLRGSPSIICGIGIDGRTRFINPAGEKTTGYREYELHQTNWWKTFYPGKEFTQVKKLFTELKKGDVKDFEMFLTAKNGEKRIISWSSMIRLDKKGQWSDIILFGNDITERRAAEEALIENENRLRRIAEASFEGIGFAEEGKIIDANPQLANIFGYTLSEIIGREIMDLVAPEHRDLVIQRIKSGFKKAYEHKAVKKDGTLFYVEVRGQQISYKGKTIRVTAVRDITERKRIENELYQSKQMLELVLDNIPQRVFWKDQTLRYLGCNKPFARDANIESALDIIGKDDFELSWKDTAELYRADDRKVMNSNSPKLDYEEPQSTPDGNSLWLRINKVPLHDQQGEVIGMLGTYEDITEEKRIEEALRESENKYRQLFQNASDTIFIMKDQTFIDCNQKTLEMFGCTREQIIGKSPYHFSPAFQPDGRNSKEKALEKIKNAFNGKSQFFEWKHSRYDGTEFYTEVNLYTVELSTGIHLLAIVRDIDERKKAEQEYEELQLQLLQIQKLESIGTLAGGIAHDFNNLLTVINGHSEMALAKISSRPQDNIVHHDLVSIHKACEKAIGVTKQILAFSRKQIFEPKIIDINEAIKELNNMLNRLIGENIVIETDLKPGLPPIKADPAQLEQVLINLIINARDAINASTSPENERKIMIQTGYTQLDQVFKDKHPGSQTGPHILILIHDTGIGINDQIITKIFEPFFTTKAIGKGTGLGLATVYGIIKQNNGSIWVDSKPGKGSKFRVYWPVTSENSNPVRIEKENPGNYQGKETILLVEDDPAVREFTRTALQKFGYDVYEAGNGNEALKLITSRNLPINLVITDLIMPEMNGKELAEKISKCLPRTSVLFTSGYTEDYIVHSGELEAGINFLQKPYSMNILAQKVRNILDRNCS